MSSEIILITTYLDEVSEGLESRESNELIENVKALIELSHFLMDKISFIQNELAEYRLASEGSIQDLNVQLEYKQKIVEQLQILVSQEQDRSQELQETVIQIETELALLQHNNMISNQTELALRTISDRYNEQQQVLQKVIQETNKNVTNLNKYMNLNQKLEKDKQQLNDKYMESLRLSEILEKQNQKINTELAQYKQLVQRIKTDNQTMDTKSKQNCESLSFIPQLSSQQSISSQHRYQNIKSMINSQKCHKRCDADIAQRPFTIKEINSNQPSITNFGRDSIQMRRIDSLVQIESQYTIGVIQKINPYQDFFRLICQCAILNSKQINKAIEIQTSHLYEQYIQKNIPYNKWIKEVEKYIMKQIQ